MQDISVEGVPMKNLDEHVPHFERIFAGLHIHCASTLLTLLTASLRNEHSDLLYFLRSL